MVDLNFRQAFLGIFKEKNWIAKLGYISIFYFLILVISSILTRLDPSTPGNITKIVNIDNPVFLLVALIFLVVALVKYVFLSIWYTYENTQAEIQNRHTKFFLKNSFLDSLKKVVKYSLVSIIYSLIPGLILGVSAVVGFIFLGAFSGSEPMGMENIGLYIVALLCLFCFAIILFALFYLFTMPIYLRLIATNTFSEAFRVGYNFKILKNYFASFFAVAMLTFVSSIIVGLVTGILTGITTGISTFNPLLGLGLEILFQLPIAIMVSYVSFYVLPGIMGGMYREVIKKEISKI